MKYKAEEKTIGGVTGILLTFERPDEPFDSNGLPFRYKSISKIEVLITKEGWYGEPHELTERTIHADLSLAYGEPTPNPDWNGMVPIVAEIAETFFNPSIHSLDEYTNRFSAIMEEL